MKIEVSQLAAISYECRSRAGQQAILGLPSLRRVTALGRPDRRVALKLMTKGVAQVIHQRA